MKKTIYIDTTAHGFIVDWMKHDDDFEKLIVDAFGLEYQDDLVSAIKEYIFMEARVLKANNKKGDQYVLHMGNVDIQITYED